MRKSRFILNLIAATAIGLTVFGCESSNSGAIADTSDIAINSGGNQSANERRNLREYLLVAERGNVAPQAGPAFGPGQDAPSVLNGRPLVAGGFGDEVRTERARMFELVGIANQPVPNINILGPGSTADNEEDPTVPEVGGNVSNVGTTGYHDVLADPGGQFVIAISRAKNRGVAGDTEVQNTQMQIFSLEIEDPLDEVFPPVFLWGDVFDRTPIQAFPANQGQFASGAWAPSGLHFYLGLGGAIRSHTIDRNLGRVEGFQVVPFPTGPSGVNNPMKLLATADNQFLFAVDNANGQILRFSRDAATGALTALGATPTVLDPRGATIDRTGQFLYIVGRNSGQLAGYRIEGDGSLTQIKIFAFNPGPITVDLGSPLGDIDANPQADQLFLATYAGVVGGYSINPTTGELNATGQPRPVLAGSRNTTNIEVEPTGRFVIAVQEADYEEFQSFVTVANGFDVPEDPIFANLVALTNDTAGGTFSLTPQVDTNGRTVFVLPQGTDTAFNGSIEAFRIEANGSVRVEAQVDAFNPYGIDFFQRVLAPLPPAVTGNPTPLVP